MPSNPHYEAVRAKVIMACPELMDLSFGCRLNHPEYPKYAVINDVRGIGNGSEIKYWTDKGHTFYSDWKKENKIRRNFSSEEWWEIIGHPITLAHVLRTIQMATREIAIDTEGEIFNWFEENLPMICKWDLTKDDFAEQDPSVWEALDKMLSV